MADSAAGPANRNPFPGLRPFRPDEEHLFFGRENQVDRMVDKLAVRRFLAVVGTSGSGKSSLVNCGLRPALHRGYMATAGAAWRMAQFRPGHNPIGALALALAAPGVLFDAESDDGLPLEQIVEATLRLGSLGLIDIVEQARLPPGVNLLVVADQFEELFRFRALAQQGAKADYGPSEDAVAFVRMLLEAIAQGALPIHVVLTMRSDFLGECSQFHGLPEAINEGQYLVPRLTRDEIRAAISGPVSVAGAAITPVLLTRLLNDVGDNPDQLSILQHALNRTWAHWENEGQRQGALDLPHYLAIGGMLHALDQHAEKAFGELAGARQQRICEGVFRALTDRGTDPRGIRRPTRLADLCAITAASQDELVAVIDRFRKPTRSFLMPPLSEAVSAESVIDISHESLMRVWERLATWAYKEADSARVYRRVSETAGLHAAGQASLWRDPDLGLALDWRQRDQPTAAWAAQYQGGFDTSMAFLDRSRDALSAEKVEAEITRRWQAGWNILPIALVVVPFIFAQQPLAEWLGTIFGSSGNPTVARWAPRLSHLLAGIPALLGYLLLTHYGKKLFRRFALPSLEQQSAAGIDVSAILDREDQRKAASAVEVHATVYASFWRRAGAHALDWVVCAMLAMIPLLIFSAVIPQSPDAAGAAGSVAAPASAGASASAAESATDPAADLVGIAAILIAALVFWLYHALTLASARQATFGMRSVGIFVTDLAGCPLGFARATARHFASVLSYYSALLGFLMQPFNDRRQTLHDRLSGSVVLKRPRRP